jgi:hypothetical protein
MKALCPTLNRNAISFVARQPFLDWLNSIDPTNADLTLAEVNRETTLYLIPELER